MQSKNITRDRGPWQWTKRYSAEGKCIARLLETTTKPVDCNDPVILAVREDWINVEPTDRKVAYELIRLAPQLRDQLSKFVLLTASRSTLIPELEVAINEANALLLLANGGAGKTPEHTVCAKVQMQTKPNANSGLPSPNELAVEFSRVIREWLSPIEIKLVNADNKGRGYSNDVCSSGDYCDSNMAMSEAAESLGVNIWGDGDIETGMPQDVLDFWNAAWQTAKENHFRRQLVRTDFGTYAFEMHGLQITGFLNDPNTIAIYDPDGPSESSIPWRYGFEVVDTGIQSTAWYQEFLLDGRVVHMLISDSQAMTHHIGPSDEVYIGIYEGSGLAALGAACIASWTQKNWPLVDENLPVHQP